MKRVIDGPAIDLDLHQPLRPSAYLCVPEADIAGLDIPDHRTDCVGGTVMASLEALNSAG
ncbi:MAG: hypothetical protein EOR45_37270 [Mesorhizobium sp.]|nr:MAG: hypothetical protein EOR45_37270 [Mesorhizobium sp.]